MTEILGAPAAQGQEKKRTGQNPPCTPDPRRTRAARISHQIFASLRRARRRLPKTRRHPHADPHTATLHARAKVQPNVFSLTPGAARSLFRARPKGSCRAQRWGEEAQRGERSFSPEAETEAERTFATTTMRAHPRGKRPVGAKILVAAVRRQPFPWVPAGDFLPDQRGQEVDCPRRTSRSGMPGLRPRVQRPPRRLKNVVKILPWTGTFPLPASSTGKRTDAPRKHWKG